MALAPFLCLLVIAVQGVADVPSPRPRGWVADQAGVIDDADEAALDRTLDDLHRERGAEVAVVTVDDVPGTPKEFATALFAHWGLGRAGHDDGVLVLLVMGQRRLEIETGAGVEAALPAAWLAELQAQRMVPAFKQGRMGAGLVAGVDGIVSRLRGLAEVDVPSTPGEYRGGDGAATAPPVGSPGTDEPATAREPDDDDDDGGSGRGWLVAGGTAGGLGAAGLGALALRRRRRRCATCKVAMLPLDEVADDAHLSAGQISEERVGSMNYEVLICPRCQDSKTIAHRKWFSGKVRCSACRFRTATSTSRTTVHATYDHGGTVEITERCVHCNHTATRVRHTARRTRPSTTSTSSGRSWSSSSSSRSSYSSSSRSSSSGFGGGRSRGGGAGSSW